MYLCKFGQNPFTGSEDNVQKRSYTDIGTDAHWNTKHNQYVTPFGLMVGDINMNLLIYVNLNSVHMTNLLISLLMEYNYL